MTIEINLVIDPKIFIDTKFWLTRSYTLNIFRTKKFNMLIIKDFLWPIYFCGLKRFCLDSKFECYLIWTKKYFRPKPKNSDPIMLLGWSFYKPKFVRPKKNLHTIDMNLIPNLIWIPLGVISLIRVFVYSLISYVIFHP